MPNSFLDDLCKALENQEPTEDIMKDAVGKGGPDLPAQKKAMDDETGNTDAPGDPKANPVGKDDPEMDPSKTDLEAQKDSSLENAESVRTPGDPNGNPDPTAPGTEAFGMISKAERKKYMDMDPKALMKAYMDAAQPVSVWSREEATKQLEAVSEDEDLEPGEGKVISLGGGFGVQYFYKDGGCALEWATGDGKRNPKYQIAYTRSMATYLAKRDKKQAKEAAKAAKEAPASEMEGFSEDTLTGFTANRDLHKNRNLIPLAQEKAARDPSGNTGDPNTNKRTPVSPSGDTKRVELQQFINDSYDKSGHTETPGVNGTPVSKSGDSKPVGKNEFEKAADDKDGNPDSPGVNGDPAPSFEAFITACEQLRTDEPLGTIMIPENMSIESYAMELGMGIIAARAMEASLTKAERDALKDSDFGLPSQRGWPLHDESHVRDAVSKFHWCPKENQRELAKNILKAMRKFGINDMQVSEANPFSKYCPKEWVVPRKKPERKAKAEG